MSWLLAVPSFLANAALLYGVYELSIVRGNGDIPTLDVFWQGFVKNTAIYSIIGAFLVSELYRWTQSDAFLRLTYNDRWLSFAVFVLISLIIALPALALDFLAARDLDVPGTAMADLYRRDSQKDVVAGHIIVRDLGLLVPLVFAILMWILWHILNSPASVAVPTALRQYAESVGLSPDEERDLARIQFPTRRPETQQAWQQIHEALRQDDHADG